MPTLAFPFRPTRSVRTTVIRGEPRAIGLGICSAVLFLFVFVDAMVRSRAFYDLWALQTVQDINLPYRDTVLPKIEHLTDSGGAILAWTVVLGGFIIVRRWIWACVVGLVPFGGAVNLVLSALVARARPHTDELLRSSLNPEERSFPSGHVMGAVMLYGLLFVAAGELRQPILRLLVRGACLSVITIAGFQRLWVGAHWPSDVIGGYLLGGLLLACLLVCREYLAAGMTTQFVNSPTAKLILTRFAAVRFGHRSSQATLPMRSEERTDIGTVIGDFPGPASDSTRREVGPRTR
jgi:undecaprenyl-diphosphatase